MLSFLEGEMGINLNQLKEWLLPEDIAWCKNDAE
jgi:hypothetical protein